MRNRYLKQIGDLLSSIDKVYINTKTEQEVPFEETDDTIGIKTNGIVSNKSK